MSFKDLTTIKDLVLIVTPVITILIAIHGINKWKNEFRSKAYFEASYKLLKSVYKLRNNFATLRNSFIMANEMLAQNDNILNYDIENNR